MRRGRSGERGDVRCKISLVKYYEAQLDGLKNQVALANQLNESLKTNNRDVKDVVKGQDALRLF